jgi:heme-degrading monooxygenase HmoA
LECGGDITAGIFSTETVMVLEVAILDIRQGQQDAFETNFQLAISILTNSPGYISHQLQRCVENSSRYLLLVNWKTLEDHTVGFRRSSKYDTWRQLLHHFYDPFPTVEHYQLV